MAVITYFRSSVQPSQVSNIPVLDQLPDRKKNHSMVWKGICTDARAVYGVLVCQFRSLLSNPLWMMQKLCFFERTDEQPQRHAHIASKRL